MLWIAGTHVKNPAAIRLGVFDLTKADRTADGTMVMDIIATKRRVDVTWKFISDTDLALIVDTITAHKPFFTLRYPEAGRERTITCYAGDINTSLWHTIGGVRTWEECTIAFIEQ